MDNSGIILCIFEVHWLLFTIIDVLQANPETKPLWERLVTPICKNVTTGNNDCSTTLSLPSNMSILYDASCGAGTLAKTYPSPLTISTSTSNNVSSTSDASASAGGKLLVPCGYAGGIGPGTVENVLTQLVTVTNGTRVWVDMESSLRTLTVASATAGSTPVDVFDIHKCFLCVKVAMQFGLPASKFSLLSI